MRRFLILLTIGLWGTAAWTQDSPPSALDGPTEVRVDPPGIHVMVIDGGNPDHSHPWFKDANGRQVTLPVPPHYINEGYQDALSPDRQRFEDGRIPPGEVAQHWAARWHWATRDSATAQFIRQATALNTRMGRRIVGGITLVVGLASLWMGLDATQLTPFAFPVEKWSVSLLSSFGSSLLTFGTVWGGPRVLPWAPNLIYYARNFGRWSAEKVKLIRPKPQQGDGSELSGVDMIPIMIRLASDMRHPTHVTGTIAGDDSPDSKKLKTDLTIHNLDFDELGLSDKGFLIGPVSMRIRYLVAQARRVLGISSGPRTAQSEIAASDFLDQFFELQNMFFQNLVKYINDHNIRSVNMSYGADAMGIRKGLAQYFAGRDVLQIALSEVVSERLAARQRDSYQFLFKNCPNTVFFIAAGNDTSPVHRSTELFTGVDGPNVLVSGAADDLLRIAEFSNYSPDRVDTFGFGVNRISALPGGRTGPMSGTSMASPYTMALDLLLLRLNPNLTAEERAEILRKGSVKVQGISYAARSGGVSVDILVVAHYLFHELKKRGLLKTVPDLAPLLTIHAPQNRRRFGEEEGASTRTSDDTQRAAEIRAQLIFEDLFFRVSTGPQAHFKAELADLHAGMTSSVSSVLATLSVTATHTADPAPPADPDAPKEGAKKPEPPDPFALTKESIKLMASYLAAVESGQPLDAEQHRAVEQALMTLNIQQLKAQAPLLKYFVTPDDPKFRSNDFPLKFDRLEFTWDQFKPTLTTSNLSTGHILFLITEFLKYGKPLKEHEAQELIRLMVETRHRFNAILTVGRLILQYSEIDLSIYNPKLNQREKISDTLKRATTGYPPLNLAAECDRWGPKS